MPLRERSLLPYRLPPSWRVPGGAPCLFPWQRPLPWQCGRRTRAGLPTGGTAELRPHPAQQRGEDGGDVPGVVAAAMVCAFERQADVA